MKKYLVIGLILMAAAALAAAQGNGLFIGGSYGRAYVNTQFSDLEGGHFTLEGNDNAWRGFTGFKFGLLGVEAGYRNLGAVEDSHNTVVYSTKARGYDAFATLNLGVGPVNFFGKAGYLFWNEDIHDILDHTSTHGADPAWGVGVSFNIAHIAIRAEWEEFKLENIDHLSMASVGIAFTF
jgi:hypothetical protein